MSRKKKTSFTIQRLAVLSIFLVGSAFCLWYFFIRPQIGNASNIQPLPRGFVSHGIDVSHHQGHIDWDVVLDRMDTTLSFVYCKVTEGTNFVDNQWKRNHEILSQKEMKHGGYHFFTPDVSAKFQAKHFLNNYRPKQADLPPVLDAEVEATTDQRLIDGMKEWLRIVEVQSGIRPVIYTSYSMYRDKMKGKFDGYQFWIASYNSDETRIQDPQIIHWQYSDRGTIPGISGSVDLNFSKVPFAEPVELAQ